MMQTWNQHNNIFSINASDINIGIRPGEHIELPGITVTIKVWREKLDMFLGNYCCGKQVYHL